MHSAFTVAHLAADWPANSRAVSILAEFIQVYSLQDQNEYTAACDRVENYTPLPYTAATHSAVFARCIVPSVL